MRGFVDGEYQDGELRGMTLICGNRGMGKTTEMARLLCQCTGDAAFFDSVSKHAAVLRGWTVVSEPGAMKEVIRLARARRVASRILYQPRGGSFDAHFESFCEIVLAVGDTIVGIDEVDKCCGARFGDSHMPKGLYDIVNYGRHHKVSTLVTVRNPFRVSYDLVNECAFMRLFRLKPRYVAYFKEWLEAEDLALLQRLEKYQYLYWTDECERGEVKGGRR